MSEKILVAVDFSKTGEAVARYAHKLSSSTKAAITFVHVVPQSNLLLYDYAPGVPDFLEQQEAKLDSIAKKNYSSCRRIRTASKSFLREIRRKPYSITQKSMATPCLFSGTKDTVRWSVFLSEAPLIRSLLTLRALYWSTVPRWMKQRSHNG